MAGGDAVQQIKDKLTIEEVIAPYVELHKAGKNLKGKSPFTSEKTPSFYVSPDRGMYYCFSSNQGGDMFTFIEAMEGVDFKGALKILAEKAGVELVPENPQKRTEREQKYAALEAATKFYSEQLEEPGGEAARQYLEKRGVTEKTKQLWRVGFVPDEWRAVKTELESQKFSEVTIRGVGLIKGEGGKEPYDVFRHRILFPIFDPSGRVVAFSGRTLSTDPETPKYVNSPETELFNKSEILYGYDKAKHGIRKFDFSLIVEGQFDVVLAHQAGYNNAVAVSGTALTGAHANLLGRLSKRVVLALDADRAGLAAMKKAADLMLPRGMDIKVARIPEEKDPADIIQAETETFKKIIGQSVHVIEHLLDVYEKSSRDERAFKIAVREEVLPVLLRIPSTIDREHFEGVVAERSGTTKDGVHQELTRMAESMAHTTASHEVPKPKTDDTKATTTDRVDEMMAYAVAIHAVLPEGTKARYEEAFHEVTDETFAVAAKAVSGQQVSRLLFSLDRENVDVPERELIASAAHNLTQLRNVLTMRRIQELRAEQTASTDEVRQGEIMESISKLAAVKALPPVSLEA